MKKGLWYVIGAIVVIGIIVFFGLGGCNKIGFVKTTKNITDTCSVEKQRADSLQRELNKCLGVPEPLTVEEQMNQMREEIASLKQQPVEVVQVRTTPTRRKQKVSAPAPMLDITESSFSSGFEIQPVKSSTMTTTTFESDGGSTPITLYEGGAKDDYGVTISVTGHMVYYLKNSVFLAAKPTAPAPRLHSKDGQQFTLDQNSGIWFCESDHLVSVQEINNWTYAAEWSIYIGEVSYGSGSYSAFLPHQLLKPLINKIRGKEWGEITDSDLQRMRAENPNIWTPNAEGTVRPFRVNENNGKVIGREDNNLYVGWVWRNTIYAHKKTTIN
jgi:hypothetical protein